MKFAEQIAGFTIDQKKSLLLAIQRKYLPEEDLGFDTLTDGSMIEQILAYLLAESEGERQDVLQGVHDHMHTVLLQCEQLLNKAKLFDMELEIIVNKQNDDDNEALLNTL